MSAILSRPQRVNLTKSIHDADDIFQNANTVTFIIPFLNGM